MLFHTRSGTYRHEPGPGQAFRCMGFRNPLGDGCFGHDFCEEFFSFFFWWCPKFGFVFVKSLGNRKNHPATRGQIFKDAWEESREIKDRQWDMWMSWRYVNFWISSLSNWGICCPKIDYIHVFL